MEEEEEEEDDDNIKNTEEGNIANNQPMELDNKSKKKKKKKGDDITFKSYLKHWRFYTCFIIFSFKNVHPNLIISSFQVFAIHYESVSTSAQKIITTTSFIVNLFTTFCLSFFVDKFRYRLVIIPTFLLILVHSLTFQFILKHGVLYVVYFFAVGLLVSIDNLASFPHFMKIFGGRFFAIIFGIFSMGTGLFNFAMNSLVDRVLSNKNKGEEYDNTLNLFFYVSSIFTTISLSFMFLENEKMIFPGMERKKK